MAVCSMASSGAEPAHATCTEAGLPATKMSSPSSPFSRNLTGTALPAFIALMIGRLSTGW